MPFFDTHCHLQMKAFEGALEGVFADMRANDVGYALCVATEVFEIEPVKEIIHAFPGIYGTFALSPQDEDLPELTENEIAKMIADNHFVAVGETGLDFYYFKNRPTWQKERFMTHIKAAKLAGVPFAIHCRDAFEDTLSILKSEAAYGVPFVMHSFAGDAALARQFLDLGGYLSFSGMLTFKNAGSIAEAARIAPLDRILIETDSPYLAPIPHRGERNSPAFVPFVAAKIADLKGLDLATIRNQTTDNAKKLFAICD